MGKHGRGARVKSKKEEDAAGGREGASQAGRPRLKNISIMMERESETVRVLFFFLLSAHHLSLPLAAALSIRHGPANS